MDQMFNSAAIRLCREELKLTLIITDMIAMRKKKKASRVYIGVWFDNYLGCFQK